MKIILEVTAEVLKNQKTKRKKIMKTKKNTEQITAPCQKRGGRGGRNFSTPNKH